MPTPITKIPAPIIAPNELWQMNGDEFNEWRRNHDYPRIISFLKRRIEHFEDWMNDEGVNDDLLLRYSPAAFLKDESVLFLYQTIDKKGFKNEMLLDYYVEIGENINNHFEVVERQGILTFYEYYYQFHAMGLGLSIGIYITSKKGRKHYILDELELLDLGNCSLSGISFGQDRLLDFVNISNLDISYCQGNAHLNLSFSSAQNISIEGDFNFVTAYETDFGEIHTQKMKGLSLRNGYFHHWSFKRSILILNTNNVILSDWDFYGNHFSCVISNTDLRNCEFNCPKPKKPVDYGSRMRFHEHCKQLYSQIGRKKEAAKHYYLQKTYERNSFKYSKENYPKELIDFKTGKEKKDVRRIYHRRWLVSRFLNVLWGYGKKPERIFFISIITILLFTVAYCYIPYSDKETFHNLPTSLYFSLVTFTTLGFGDIHQTNTILRLFSGMEALLGMSFWGLLIAGFANKAKDY